MTNKFNLILIIAIANLIAGINVYSQKNQNDFSGKIEKIKISKLINKLELDSSTAEVFTSKYKDYYMTVKDLTKQRNQHFRAMVRNLDNSDSLDIYLDKIIKYESEIDDKKIEFLNDMKSILTSKQIATMIIFERKFNTQVKKLMQDLKKDKSNKKGKRNN